VLIYIIYILIFLILVYVTFIAVKAIDRGIEAKQRKKLKSIDNNNKKK